ncbi:hypothetical protein [Rhizobium sp. LC145]|uniref:hypothetical protein n=1 Tax=Rhizobium sp. LC145 TaxID=1120688 RepID=UPI001FD8A51B|nr:hypothetical protein [Rhizobium sp. LC145]
MFVWNKQRPKRREYYCRKNADPLNRPNGWRMSLEPIGIFTLVLGLYCLFASRNATVVAFITLTVFGAAGAILAGSANIQPAHLFLAFLAVATFSFRTNFSVAIRALNFPQPAFWLACLVVYGIASGFFAPRLLARMSEIIPLGASEYPSTGSTVPLGPVSSNFTQAVYLAADLLTFLLMIAIGSTKAGFKAITIGIISFSFANALFGILDLVTYGTGAQDIFLFIRNAQYTFHHDDVVAGVKRIVGSWPEASAFAGMTLGAIGFCGTMWLCGRYHRWTGALFLLSLILMVRSTSSTGLLALPICFLILYVTAVMRSGGRSGTWSSSGVVLFVPPLLLLGLLIIVLNDELYRRIYDYIDLLLLSKTTSSSAAERGAWNFHGYQNFLDSYGWGVGLGTSRTSSFVIALLSNVGVPGTVFFLLFAFTTFFKRRGIPRSMTSDVRLAARNACGSLMIGALVAGPTVDLGLMFFILAGVVAAQPETEDVRGSLPQHASLAAT